MNLPRFLQQIQRRGRKPLIVPDRRAMAEIRLIVLLHRTKGWGYRKLSDHMEERDARAEGREPIPMDGKPDTSPRKYVPYGEVRPWIHRRWSRRYTEIAIKRWFPQMQAMRQLIIRNRREKLGLTMRDVLKRIRGTCDPDRYTREDVLAGRHLPNGRLMQDGRVIGRKKGSGRPKREKARGPEGFVDQIAEAQRMRAEGCSDKQIMRALGINGDVFLHALLRAGTSTPATQ